MKTLSRGFLGWVSVGALGLGAGFLWQRAHASGAAALCWLIVSGLGTAYLTVYTLRHLEENRPTPDAPRYDALGAANTLTWLRGLAVMLMLGFFCPRTASGWAPGLLYTFVALTDWWDGLLARLTGHTSLLGKRLDMFVDSVGVLAATALAVALGHLPWWYLSVGLARYAFLGWEALLRALGRSPRPTPADPQRRANAGLMMSFLAAALWPLFSARALALIGFWFLIPFLGLFLRDAAWEAGWGKATVGAHRWPKAKALLRLLAALTLAAALQSPAVSPFLRWGSGLMAALLALGILPRLAALGSLLALAAAWTAGLPPNALAALAAAALTAIAFYGGGAACLWAPDDRVFLTHVGAAPPDSPKNAASPCTSAHNCP